MAGRGAPNRRYGAGYSRPSYDSAATKPDGARRDTSVGGGQTWGLTTDALASVGYDSIVYGAGKWVAVTVRENIEVSRN